MKAIIVGASSGIGKALAVKLAEEGYDLGLTARRYDLLESLSKELQVNTFIEKMDVSDLDASKKTFEYLLEKMGDVDLVILSAGTGDLNEVLDNRIEQDAVDVNVAGFVNLSCSAYRYFHQKGKGHLVGISSVGALRGNPVAPAYNASKAFVSNYMEGLRLKSFKDKAGISVTDIRPGFVDTAMAKGEGLFWVASPHVAANQIYDSIQKKKSVAYITKRWRLIAWLMKIMPEFLLKKM